MLAGFVFAALPGTQTSSSFLEQKMTMNLRKSSVHTEVQLAE